MSCPTCLPTSRSDSMKDGKCFGAHVYENYQARSRSTVKLPPTDVYYPNRGAVVSIYTQIEDVLFFTKTKLGSGFFVAPDIIVTAASVVLINGNEQTRTPPPYQGVDIIRANKFYVRVQNVRNKGDSYFYDARLLYVSPSFDVAMLEVIPPIDKCTPGISPHPILKFANSRNTAIGEMVYVMGDYLNHESTGISQGIVIDNVYNDPRLLDIDENNVNFWGFEAVVTDIDIRKGDIGGPLFNEYGRVIGIISGLDMFYEGYFQMEYDSDWPYLHTKRAVAVAEHVVQPIIETFLCGPADEKTGCRLELIRDPLGNFYRFTYGFLGINAYEAFGPQHLALVPNSKYRRQRGFIYMNGEAGSPLDPVNGPFPNPWNGGDFDPTQQEMYLLTSINGNPLGVGEGQLCFTTITRLHCPGATIEIHYRLGSENFGKSHFINLTLAEFPQQFDSPPGFNDYIQTARSKKQDTTERGLSLVHQAFGGRNMVKDLSKLAQNAKKIVQFLKEHGVEILDENKDGKVSFVEGVSNALELGSAALSAVASDGVPTTVDGAVDLVLSAASTMIPEENVDLVQ